MATLVPGNHEFSSKLLAAGFFWTDLVNDQGATSGTLASMGFSDAEMRDGSYAQRIHPDDYPTFIALWERVRDGLQDELHVEYRLSDQRGDWRWVETYAMVVSRTPDGTMREIVGTDRFIDSRKRTQLFLEREMRETNRKLEIAQSLLMAGPATTEFRGFQTRLRDAVSRFADSLNFEHCDILVESDAEPRCILSHPDVNGCQIEDDWQSLYRAASQSHYPVVQDELPEGAPFSSCLAVPLRLEDHFVGAMLLYQHESSAFHSVDVFNTLSSANMLALAIHNHMFFSSTVARLERDGLTGLLTRGSFGQDGDATWNRFCGLHSDNAVVMMDIDHFKQINDNFGHPAGDTVIRMVAETLQAVLRSDALVARYGGEEFVAVLPDVTRQTAADIAERIRTAVLGMSVPAISGTVTVSLGVAVCDCRLAAADACTLSSMVEQADTALYHAKNTGRNRTVVVAAGDPAMTGSAGVPPRD